MPAIPEQWEEALAFRHEPQRGKCRYGDGFSWYGAVRTRPVYVFAFRSRKKAGRLMGHVGKARAGLASISATGHSFITNLLAA